MATMKCNLIFHCYPRAAGQKWRRSVEHLKARWPQFDGRRIVGVATDDTTDSFECVKAAFGDCAEGTRFEEFHNSRLQEVQTFASMLSAVHADTDSITLYAHSKGCTHIADNAASHLWCDAMASACLDYPALIECVMQTAHTCGAFRSTQPIGFPVSPEWHFAGTWYWFKNNELFKRDWANIQQTFWGVESYPGRHFAKDQSACLFYDHAETGHLYANDFWDSSIIPAFRWWRERLAKCGLTPLADPPACDRLNKLAKGIQCTKIQ